MNRLHPLRPAFWFLVALVVRLGYLFEQSGSAPTFYHPVLDEAEMVETARQWAAGKVDGEPFFKAPLYPALLAVLHLSSGDMLFFTARLLQHLLGALLVVIAFDLARRLAPPARDGWAGAIAAGLLALNGPLIRLEGCLLLDFLTVFLQSAALWLLCAGLQRTDGRAWIRLLQAGLALGVAWLNRPTILPVVALLAVVAALLVRFGGHERLRPRHALLLPAGFAPAVALFAALNLWISGTPAWQPWQGGYNFFEANRPGANGRYLKQQSFVGGGGANPTREAMLRGWAVAEGKTRVEQASDFARVSGWWMGRGVEQIRREPAAWLELMLRKAVYLGSAREIYNIEDYGIVRGLSGWLPWMFAGFGLILPLCLASLAAPGLFRGGAAVLWAYAAGLGGCIALFYVSGRLRMPLVFPAAVLAGAGLSALAAAPGPRKLAALALAGVGTLWAWGDWWGVRSEDFRAVEFARLSHANYLDGDARGALELADRAAEADPQYPTLPQLRAQALFVLARFPEAAAAFEQAAARIPNDPSAPHNLGLVLFRQLASPERALGWFEESLRRDPGYRDAAWMQVRALARLGEWTEATRRFDAFSRDLPPRVTTNLEAAYAVALIRGESAAAVQQARRDLLSAPWGEGRAAEIEAEIAAARARGTR